MTKIVDSNGPKLNLASAYQQSRGVRVKKFLATTLLALVGQCLFTSGAQSQQPESQASPALLYFAKGYEAGLGTGGLQSYAAAPGQDCRSWKPAAEFGAFAKKNKGDLKLQPGMPFSVYGEILYKSYAGAAPGGFNMQDSTCWTAATFVPISGHRYRAVHTWVRGSACRLSITDEMTGQDVGAVLLIDKEHCPPPKVSGATIILANPSKFQRQ